ncbi:hypothetical protein Cgig2_016838 [Carnegiea gigantea]|uniref:Uncharacterized protein n=1 Tax=Carnegiea gigantea TaxID=171969 RepID=A0A9Q1GKJ7_9CARY|nr:hypothetical protein Cgig2_016838 [Carnegiea gigantea]
MYVTLGVPFGGREIIEISKSSTDVEYDKDGSESFKRNFIIYFVNCFFSRPKSRYYSKSILKFIKDVSQIASLDWCEFVMDKLITSVRHYKESTDAKGDKTSNDSGAPSFSPTLSLHKLDSEDQISRTVLVADASVTIEKEDHHEDVVLAQQTIIPSYSLWLGLSQSDSQSPIPHTTSVPNPSTAGFNEDDGREDDDDVNRELRVKKLAKIKSKKVEQKKGSPRAYSEQRAPHSRKPKLTKEVLLQKDHDRRVGTTRTLENSKEVGLSDALKKRQPENLPLAYCSLYVIRLTKLDIELSQDELVISEYVFGKVKDVDDSEPLFDGCGDQEATRISMATLKPGEEVKINVINI